MYFRFSAIVWYVFSVGSKPIRTKSMELLLDQSLSSKNVKATGGSIQNVNWKQSLTEKEKLLKIL